MPPALLAVGTAVNGGVSPPALVAIDGARPCAPPGKMLARPTVPANLAFRIGGGPPRVGVYPDGTRRLAARDRALRISSGRSASVALPDGGAQPLTAAQARLEAHLSVAGLHLDPDVPRAGLGLDADVLGREQPPHHDSLRSWTSTPLLDVAGEVPPEPRVVSCNPRE